MANNRMYLRCTVCGDNDTLFLGKTMGSGYYQPPTAEAMQAFFDEHEPCTAGALDWTNYRIGYELATDAALEVPVDAKHFQIPTPTPERTPDA